ncbi:formimidoylglutamate deiminase [Haliangium ochraceum]|uniref:Formiminoglutamate deiminase n=1 Tax=Haliangium ochraceum (strain DSM 14365 / JCM 11303 / SMP-2) TaxID=502025 RepID=D0LYT1_HALO1|nr:formimidoylglutamate deiminase [Haliangium ochraceum]ACY14401.1 formiminoglutamate deiminase [Haliangium ochraceum DSM 14365]
MQRLFARRALLPEGWARDVCVEIGEDGCASAVRAGAAAPPDAETVPGVLVPGMPNLHSHAFQRAMAGLGERGHFAAPPTEVGAPASVSDVVHASDDAAARAAAARDSFWSWRETMYAFVAQLSPDDVHAIASQLFVEMLTAGYTGVAEFHYLHHAPDGRPYADPAAMAEAVIAAARETGIALTLLPVLYVHGGFGDQPAGPAQRRFVHAPDDFAALLQLLATRHAGAPGLRLGVAPHSLRAVSPSALARVIAAGDALGEDAPVHVHVAEQIREVEDCVAWSGRRPVAWLLDHAPVGPRWCLVHATHIDADELHALARSGAVAGLCPSTEANLGDGLFPLAAYLEAGGALGIGSDSNVSVSPRAELRLLEYGQRLRAQARNIAASPARPATGARLYAAALDGGARALGQPMGAIAPGHRADYLALDDEHPLLVGRSDDLVLDALVFAGEHNPLRQVMVGGAWVVRDGAHPAQAEVAARYRRVMRKLLG